MRLSIGHLGREKMASPYVLSYFPNPDVDWLDNVLRGGTDGAGYLADEDGDKFMNAATLRATSRDYRAIQTGAGTRGGQSARHAKASGPVRVGSSALPLRPDCGPTPASFQYDTQMGDNI